MMKLVVEAINRIKEKNQNWRPSLAEAHQPNDISKDTTNIKTGAWMLKTQSSDQSLAQIHSSLNQLQPKPWLQFKPDFHPKTTPA